MANQKIRNATQSKSKGITFKSQLEKTVYNTLIQEGFNPQYEPTTFTLWDSFLPITPYYDKETDKQKEITLFLITTPYHLVSAYGTYEVFLS